MKTQQQVLCEDRRPEFITEWYCIPPRYGTRYKVTSDRWREGPDGGRPVREIHGWVYGDDFE